MWRNNYVWAHQKCNRAKGGRPPTEDERQRHRDLLKKAHAMRRKTALKLSVLYGLRG
jgi:hypothetical protein